MRVFAIFLCLLVRLVACILSLSETHSSMAARLSFALVSGAGYLSLMDSFTLLNLHSLLDARPGKVSHCAFVLKCYFRIYNPLFVCFALPWCRGFARGVEALPWCLCPGAEALRVPFGA